MICYSSIWDAILKFVTFVGVALVLFPFNDWLPENNRTVIAVAGIVLIWVWAYRSGVSIIASWLHGRVTLGAPITLEDAKDLRCLFQLDLSMKWLPLTDIRKLPKQDRRAALLSALRTLGPQRKSMFV